MALRIHGRSTSYNVQKVLWFADELNLTYEHVLRGGKYGGINTKEFAAMNPMQKVPVLEDDDQYIWESNTILRYLAGKFGGQRWSRPDPLERSLSERWMDWCITALEPAFVGIFWGFYRTPENQQNMQAIEASRLKCIEYLDLLNGQLHGQKYLAGEKISLADIAAGVFIYRMVNIDLNIILPQNVSDWYQDLRVRPGYRKWVMSDFSELKARLAY